MISQIPIWKVSKLSDNQGRGHPGKSFKAETIKRLSPKSKCYCFSHCKASRIQKFSLSANHGGQQYFSVFHGPSTLKCISPALIIRQFYCLKASDNAVLHMGARLWMVRREYRVFRNRCT